MAGYGIDETKHPDQVEHLGITPLEAMSAGCITFCYNAGGSKELIEEGLNGYLFKSEEELFDKSIAIVGDETKQQTIRKQAKTFVTTHFKEEIFKQQIKKIIL
jgi:glycosyltransferase involved in cell wall biosynthesis